MTPGIVYYSLSGNCRFVAGQLAERLGAPAVELVERKQRREGIGFAAAAIGAVTGARSRLAGDPWIASESFDPIYLVTPIWGSNPTPAANAFLAQAELKGRTVHLVTGQADEKGAGREKALARLRQGVERAGGVVGRDWHVHTAMPGAFAGEDKLAGRVQEIVTSG